MNGRVLFLFFLLAPAAHAQVGGRVTVGTFAVRPTACSAGDLYVTSDTNLIYQCGPANTWTMAPNLNAANAFTSNNTFNGSPAITLFDTEGAQTPPVGAQIYGINNAIPTFPNSPALPAMTTPSVFTQYCRPTNDPAFHAGCGWFTSRWFGYDSNFFNFESKYSTTLDIINSDPYVTISSVSRTGNVATVTTSAAHNIRPSQGTANIAGVTGCTGGFNPNGRQFGTVTSTSATTYTFASVGAD